MTLLQPLHSFLQHTQADFFILFQLCSPADVGKHLYSKLCTCHNHITKCMFVAACFVGHNLQ